MLSLPANYAHVSSEVGFPVLVGEAVEQRKANLSDQRVKQENYAQDGHFNLVFDSKLLLFSSASALNDNPNDY